jgi:hypothetical protein
VTPSWALERAGTLSREMVDAIAASGVRTVGDLEGLVEGGGSAASPTAETAGPISVPPIVAARAAVGVLIGSGLARGARLSPAAAGPASNDPRASRPAVRGLESIPTTQIGVVFLRRINANIRRGVHDLRRGRRRSTRQD